MLARTSDAALAERRHVEKVGVLMDTAAAFEAGSIQDSSLNYFAAIAG